MDNNNEKILVSKEALFFIKNNQTIGIGAGKTTEIFIKLLGEKVKKEKLRIKVVPVSKRIKEFCRKASLHIVKSSKIDISIDGVDKVGEDFSVSKGFGAFEFENEKKLDYNADKVILIGDSSKFVKDVLDYDILMKNKNQPNADFISKAVHIKNDFYKIKINKKKIKNIFDLEKKLESLGASGLFTRFKQLIIIGFDRKNNKVFVSPREKLLQIAVDIADEKKALSLIKKTEMYVDIVELGTPLIKKQGIDFIKKIKTKKIISADFKTADTGAYESGIGIKAGADIVSVLAGSNNKTITSAVKYSHNFNKKVLVDLIDIKPKNRKKRLVEILSLKEKPDIVCVHTAIDVQKTQGFSNLADLIKLCKKENIMTALAGGIDKKKIKTLIKYKPDIFIIGGAITKSRNPGKVAKGLKEVLKKEAK